MTEIERESDSGRRDALDVPSELELLAMWTLVRGGNKVALIRVVSRRSVLCNRGLPLALAGCKYSPSYVGVETTAGTPCC